jgi:hypothetical protein
MTAGKVPESERTAAGLGRVSGIQGSVALGWGEENLLRPPGCATLYRFLTPGASNGGLLGSLTC